MKQFNLRLEDKMYEELRTISFNDRVSMNEIVRIALEEWIENKKQESKHE